jgi:hypothetical protein
MQIVGGKVESGKVEKWKSEKVETVRFQVQIKNSKQ